MWKYDSIQLWKYRNITIWTYTNIHEEKSNCEKCKRVCKESKYIYIYIKTIK